jgi:hypothetical protein
MRLTFRNGVEIDDPVRSALGFLENDYSYRSYDTRIVERKLASHLRIEERELEVGGLN